MKITTLILLISIMTVSAATNAQQITLKTKNATLEEVFDKIHQQTGYDVFYSNDQLAKAKAITVDLKNTPLAKALDIILDGQPFSYKIDDQTVVIKEKETGLLDNLTDKIKAIMANIDVHGRVVGDDGLPLSGATVIVKGGSNSTITDANGEFNLKSVEPEAIVVITFVGYTKFELKAGKEMGLIKMTLASSQLDAVQVIAYGQTTDRLSLGNVSTVGSKEIQQSPVGNVLEALEGRVPGIFITQQSGVPGAGVSVSVQGQNSIDQGNNPFYVVDGVPYISLFPSYLGGGVMGYSGAGGTGTPGSPLALLNPADIESISVLKDADATSIYGSRAANGAILITTKQGKAGETKTDINFQQGWGDVAHRLDLLNTPEYLEMRAEALKNDGITPSLQNGDYDLLQWDQSRYTDWQKVLLGNTSQYTDAQASVSGGTSQVQFLIGAAYHRETTVFPGNYADQKGSVHFSFTTRSKNNKFKVRLTGGYLVDDNHLPNVDFTSDAIRLAPNAPSGYNPDGTLNWANDADGNPTWNNPFAALAVTYARKSDNLTSNLNLSYQLLNGLTISANAGYNNIIDNELQLNPSSAYSPVLQQYIPNTAVYGTSSVESYIVEPQLDYKHTIGKSSIDALIGSTIQQTNTNLQTITGSNYSSDAVLSNVAAASSLTANATLNSIYRYNALFGRLNYNWNDEFLLTLSGRRDGSSRFGPANEFHNFGAIAGGWIFTKEEALQKALPFLSFGKLKASYGTTGNDQIPDYQFLSQYNNYYGQPYQGVKGILPTALTNPYLEWELTKKLMFGTELGFLKDRIVVNASYSIDHSSNELLTAPLSTLTGFVFIEENLPAVVRNTSWEFSLNTVNIKNSHFNWTTNFNLTVPKNTLESFPGIAQSDYASYLVVGQPLGLVKAFDYAGVNAQSGLYQFRDHTGALTTNPDPTTDNYELINTNPRFYGGLANTVTFHSFSLSFLLQFVKQTGLDDIDYGNAAGAFNGGYGNQPISVLGRWQQPGNNASVEKFSSNFSDNAELNDLQQSNAAFKDISYIKLKNFSLSWTLPKTFVQRIKLNNLRIYAQGQNLYTWTKYKGFDPENASTMFLPPLRVFTFGIQASF